MKRVTVFIICMCLTILPALVSFAEVCKTQAAFEEACNLTADDIKVMKVQGITFYMYKDFDLAQKDRAWLNDRLNKNKTIDNGAIYRSIAGLLYMCRSGVYGTFARRSELILGKEITDEAELKPYVDRMSKYFVEEGQVLPVIMKEFQSLKNVTGTYDFDNWKYEVTITDCTKCTEEMQISEETLGYLIGMVAEYAMNIKFDGNTCTIKYP